MKSGVSYKAICHSVCNCLNFTFSFSSTWTVTSSGVRFDLLGNSDCLYTVRPGLKQLNGSILCCSGFALSFGLNNFDDVIVIFFSFCFSSEIIFLIFCNPNNVSNVLVSEGCVEVPISISKLISFSGFLWSALNCLKGASNKVWLIDWRMSTVSEPNSRVLTSF